jgi:hypothetical protein
LGFDFWLWVLVFLSPSYQQVESGHFHQTVLWSPSRIRITCTTRQPSLGPGRRRTRRRLRRPGVAPRGGVRPPSRRVEAELSEVGDARLANGSSPNPIPLACLGAASSGGFLLSPHLHALDRGSLATAIVFDLIVYFTLVLLTALKFLGLLGLYRQPDWVEVRKHTSLRGVDLLC